MIFIWFAIGCGLFNNPDYSANLFSNNVNFHVNEYFIIIGAVGSISIALRNCISTRFSNCYSINNLNNNVSDSPNHSIPFKWFKILWINFMGIGGLLGPMLILSSINGYLTLMLFIYSIFYFSYMIISLVYFINKLSKSNIY